MAEFTIEAELARAANRYISDSPRATEAQARVHAQAVYDDSARVSLFLKSWKQIKKIASNMKRAESAADIERNWPESKGY